MLYIVFAIIIHYFRVGCQTNKFFLLVNYGYGQFRFWLTIKLIKLGEAQILSIASARDENMSITNSKPLPNRSLPDR
jgi:hypothetical protein